MITAANTQLTIRIQARGGMFLGPDSYNGAIVSVYDGASRLAGPAFTNNGDSGTRSSTQVQGASPFPIITPTSPSTTYWVVASDKTVAYVANLNLSAPASLKVEVRVPLPAAQGDQIVSGVVSVDPKQPPASLPGYVLEVPGLWVLPEFVVLGHTVNLKTKVTMMCGCMINDTPDNPWISSDFVVYALIGGQRVDLKFDFNSQFLGELQLPGGNHMAEIFAQQLSTGNAGKATVHFQMPLCD